MGLLRTAGEELKNLAGFSSILLFDFLLRFASETVFIAFVGQCLSAKHFHAIGLGIATSNILTYFNMGVGYAVEMVASFAHGADQHNSGILLQRGMFLTLLFATCSIVPQFFSNYLLLALGQDPEVVGLAIQFIRWNSLSTVLRQAQGMLDKFLGSKKLIVPSITSSIVSFPFSIIFSLLLIYNQVPGVSGMVGAALAMLFHRIVSLLILVVLVIARKDYLGWWHGWDLQGMLNIQKLWQLLKLAIPASIALALDMTSDELWIIVVGMSGTVNANVYNIGNSLSKLIFMMNRGLGVGTSIMMGHALGKRDERKAKVICAVGIGFSFALATLLASFTLILKDYIPFVFTRHAETVRLASEAMYLVALLMVLTSLRVMTNSVFRAFARPTLALVLLLISFYGAGLPISIFLVGLHGVFGVFAAVIIAQADNLILCLWCLVGLFDWRKEGEHIAQQMKEQH